LKLKKKDSDIILKQKKSLKNDFEELKKFQNEIFSNSMIKTIRNSIMNEDTKDDDIIEEKISEEKVQIKKPVVDKFIK
jgi:hypothetical protein